MDLLSNSVTNTMNTQQPPPIPMRKSLSLGNVYAQQPSQMNSDEHKYAIMRDSVMREVLISVPTLVSQSLCVQLVPAICQAMMESSMFASVSDTHQLMLSAAKQTFTAN